MKAVLVVLVLVLAIAAGFGAGWIAQGDNADHLRAPFVVQGRFAGSLPAGSGAEEAA
jgi:hypothetical protein